MTREQWNDRISRVDAILYVGEVAVRGHHDWLKDIGITNIVSLLTKTQAAEYDASFPVPKWCKHQTFTIGDHSDLWPKTINDVLAAIEGVTLIHCISGANRSTAIALCWLIDRGLSPIAAFNHYLETRGLATAKVYHVPPRMTPQLVNGVNRWIASRK